MKSTHESVPLKHSAVHNFMLNMIEAVLTWGNNPTLSVIVEAILVYLPGGKPCTVPESVCVPQFVATYVI